MSAVGGILGDATTALVLRALDAGALQHAVHAANIANASVEGYQPLRVEFDEQLAAALAADPAGAPVQVDREVAQMMENSVRYQALLGALDRQGALVRLAIREGRS